MSDSLEQHDGPQATSTSLASDVDAASVQTVLAGDRNAFEPLVLRHQKKAIAVSYRLLGNMNDAMEVVQNAFVKAYRSLDSLQDPRLFGPWLLRIVSNYSLNYRRGRKGHGGLPIDDLLVDDSTAGPQATPAAAAKRDDPGGPMIGGELSQKFQWALEQLPDKQRMALVLFSIENLPQRDVAEVLQCSVEAVKWHVFQARKRLKDLLADPMAE